MIQYVPRYSWDISKRRALALIYMVGTDEGTSVQVCRLEENCYTWTDELSVGNAELEDAMKKTFTRLQLKVKKYINNKENSHLMADRAWEHIKGIHDENEYEPRANTWRLSQ